MFGENKDKIVSLVVEKSTIGGDFTIEGLVNSAGEVDLGGSIKGPVNVKALIIKEKGSVIGEINAEKVDVLGFVDGKVTAKKITARANAKGRSSLRGSLGKDGATKAFPTYKTSKNVKNTIQERSGTEGGVFTGEDFD